MANNNKFGQMLFVTLVAAAAGGVAAYLRRKEIEGIVHDIADSLDAREEDGFFSVDLGEEPVFHKIPTDSEGEAEAPAEEEAASGEDEVQDSDFADTEAPQTEE